MSTEQKRINHGPLIVLSLAMALGPLTALSVGSRYADEETLARANAARTAAAMSNQIAMSETRSSIVTEPNSASL
ncbi:MAG: hypothetical protein N838_29275 [Thiohalocapsa sp. PB-PSB1]|jgi:hypothetical protein|nr:MAG: hypothetical protein N838_29275 [Thiohalocapsa sp. PB-PSB1]